MEGAHLAFDNDDHEAALVLADRAVQISPGNGAAYYQRGKARFNSMEGDEDRALEDLEKSCRLAPGEDTAYIYIARIYDGRNQKKKALAALSEGIRVCPRKRDLYKYRAALYNEDGRIDLAEKDYNDYVATGGTSECFFLRGKFYEKCGRLENALRDYTTVIKRQNRRNQVDKLVLGYKYRAGVLRRLGRHREAIADLSEAFKGDQKDDEAIRSRGFEYIAIEDYKHALADFDKAIELAPQGRQGYEGRAAVYEKLGKKDLADRDRKEAEKLEAAPAELPI
ncbi:MAG: tetratricopeptide repeat protein [Cyanobacteria bacterium HKST-UBA02]|nr:tetratricopeptide repeat protein [Cyanobacteria bacterium HKST-UBA02]